MTFPLPPGGSRSLGNAAARRPAVACPAHPARPADPYRAGPPAADSARARTRDFATAADRLRHAFGLRLYGVTPSGDPLGALELRMIGYDVLQRVQMPATASPQLLAGPGRVCARTGRPLPRTTGPSRTNSRSAQPSRASPCTSATWSPGSPLRTSPWSASTASRAWNCPRCPPVLRAGRQPRRRPPSCSTRCHRDGGRLPADPRPSSASPPTRRTGRSAADIWDLPDDLRPVPIVLLVDEVAELSLFATKDEEKRRDRIITAARPPRPARPRRRHLPGDLRAALRLRTRQGHHHAPRPAHRPHRHRVNDESSANMAFGDIAPDAVLAAIQIPDRDARHSPSPVTPPAAGPASAPRTPRCARPSTLCNRHAAPHPGPARPRAPSGPRCPVRPRWSRSRPRPRHPPPSDRPPTPVGVTASRHVPTPAMPETRKGGDRHDAASPASTPSSSKP